MGQGPTTTGFSSGYANQNSSGTQNTSSTSTPTFDARGNALINQLQNSNITDVNSAAQSAIAAQNAKTNSELGSVLAGVKSGGYGRATNWGQGNMAGAAANVLAQRDVANTGLQTQAAQQTAQNQLSQNQNLASLLSMLRGETNVGVNKQATNTSGWNLGGKMGIGGV
jgi:hypothetical protein